MSYFVTTGILWTRILLSFNKLFMCILEEYVHNIIYGYKISHIFIWSNVKIVPFTSSLFFLIFSLLHLGIAERIFLKIPKWKHDCEYINFFLSCITLFHVSLHTLKMQCKVHWSLLIIIYHELNYIPLRKKTPFT